MIQVKSLYKSFEGKDVLVDINATFNNGKTNLIIGQSGSGKTTHFYCRRHNIGSCPLRRPVRLHNG